MARQRKLFFSVSDRADGHQVTPETVPLGLLKDFVKDVAAFIRGDDKEIDASDLIVSVMKGSLALQSHEELSEGLAIWRDIEQLSNSRLDGVDLKRAAIAEKWRSEAMKRRYLPALVELIRDRKIEPGKVFDLTLPLEQVAEGYRAMDERRAIKVMLTV